MTWRGSMYPPLESIREVSVAIAAAVADVAHRQGLATQPRPEDARSCIRSPMYEPVYRSYM